MQDQDGVAKLLMEHQREHRAQTKQEEVGIVVVIFAAFGISHALLPVGSVFVKSFCHFVSSLHFVILHKPVDKLLSTALVEVADTVTHVGEVQPL